MTDTDWQALLDEKPTDRELRRAYATWLQDEADDADAAEAQRWCARAGKSPHYYSKSEPERQEPFWVWVAQSWKDIATVDDYDHAVVPNNLFAALSGPVLASCRTYASRAEAEADLARAWRQLRQAGEPTP